MGMAVFLDCVCYIKKKRRRTLTMFSFERAAIEKDQKERLGLPSSSSSVETVAEKGRMAEPINNNKTKTVDELMGTRRVPYGPTNALRPYGKDIVSFVHLCAQDEYSHHSIAMLRWLDVVAV